MSCADIQRKLADYFDSGLPRSRDLEAHLATCAHCRSFVNRLNQLDAMLLESTIHPPSDLVARVNTAVAGQRHTTQMVRVAFLLTAGLALTSAIGWFLPIVPVAKSYWTEFRGVLPKSEWVATFPTLESQVDSIRSQVASYANQLQSYPGLAVWGALLSVVMLLVVLNGMEAAEEIRRGNKSRVAE